MGPLPASDSPSDRNFLRRGKRTNSAQTTFKNVSPSVSPGGCYHRRGGERTSNFLKTLVGAARFELATPSPPDWCANRAAPRSDRSLEAYAHPARVGLLAFRSWARNRGSVPCAVAGRRNLPKSPDFARGCLSKCVVCKSRNIATAPGVSSDKARERDPPQSDVRSLGRRARLPPCLHGRSIS